jgi:hypothetical protein
MENVTPEAFAETGFNEMFSGGQPRQDVKFDGWIEAEVLVLPRYRHHPEDGDEVVPRNVGEPSHLNAACPSEKISMYWISSFHLGSLKDAVLTSLIRPRTK